MSNRMTEFKVGITVIAAVVVLIGSVMWLKSISLHEAKRTWAVRFPSTGGLATSDEVQVNGMREGQVKAMKLEGDHVLVELEMTRDVRLTRDSQVIIRSVGLMGEKVIAVVLRTTGAEYAPRDTIQGIYEPDLGEVMGQVGGTVSTMNQLAAELRDVAGQLNRNGKLAATIDNFARTSAELNRLVVDNRSRLDAALTDATTAARSARELTAGKQQELSRAIDDFSKTADHMVVLSGRLDSLLTETRALATRVNAGEGTLGRLVRDEKLYDDLNKSVLSLQALIEDVKRNPKKYFKFSVF